MSKRLYIHAQTGESEWYAPEFAAQFPDLVEVDPDIDQPAEVEADEPAPASDDSPKENK